MLDRKGTQSINCGVTTCLHYDIERKNGCRLASIEVMPIRNEIDIEEESMCHSFEKTYEPDSY